MLVTRSAIRKNQHAHSCIVLADLIHIGMPAAKNTCCYKIIARPAWALQLSPLKHAQEYGSSHNEGKTPAAFWLAAVMLVCQLPEKLFLSTPGAGQH
jgi:hypothetical protein